jgi:hypothetical protein
MVAYEERHQKALQLLLALAANKQFREELDAAYDRAPPGDAHDDPIVRAILQRWGFQDDVDPVALNEVAEDFCDRTVMQVDLWPDPARENWTEYSRTIVGLAGHNIS